LERSNEFCKRSFQFDSKSFKINITSKSEYNNDYPKLEKSTLVPISNGIEKGNDRIGFITAELLFEE